MGFAGRREGGRAKGGMANWISQLLGREGKEATIDWRTLTKVVGTAGDEESLRKKKETVRKKKRELDDAKVAWQFYTHRGGTAGCKSRKKRGSRPRRGGPTTSDIRLKKTFSKKGRRTEIKATALKKRGRERGRAKKGRGPEEKVRGRTEPQRRLGIALSDTRRRRELQNDRRGGGRKSVMWEWDGGTTKVHIG